MSAAKERRKHEADDCSQQLLLGSQAAGDRGDHVVGAIQVFEGLMDGLKRGWGVGTLVFKAFLGVEPTAFAGFGLVDGVSFHGGHGARLRPVSVV